MDALILDCGGFGVFGHGIDFTGEQVGAFLGSSDCCLGFTQYFC